MISKWDIILWVGLLLYYVSGCIISPASHVNVGDFPFDSGTRFRFLVLNCCCCSSSSLAMDSCCNPFDQNPSLHHFNELIHESISKCLPKATSFCPTLQQWWHVELKICKINGCGLKAHTQRATPLRSANTSAVFLRRLQEHAPNSSQLMGFLTLLIIGAILLLLVGFLCLCRFGVGLMAESSWMYRYLRGQNPPGSDRIDYA